MFGGGGDLFGASQGFGATQASQDAGGPRKPRSEEKQTSVPVTLQTVELAVARRSEGAEDIKIFGTEPNTVMIVANVEAVVKQSTGMELTLNDSTARMKARYFVSDPEASHLNSIVPGCYISGFGEVRTAPATHIVLNGAHVISSADEISFHIIECVHTALRIKQHLKQQPEGASFGEKAPAPMETTEPTNNYTPQKTGGRPGEFSWASTPPAATMPTQPDSMAPGNDASPAPPPASAAAAPAAASRMQPAEMKAAILAMCREESGSSEEGLSVDVICKRLGNASKDEVRSALTLLKTDGEVYDTIDDNHWTAV